MNGQSYRRVSRVVAVPTAKKAPVISAAAAAAEASRFETEDSR
jgi:hypothetical protein